MTVTVNSTLVEKSISTVTANSGYKVGKILIPNVSTPIPLESVQSITVDVKGNNDYTTAPISFTGGGGGSGAAAVATLGRLLTGVTVDTAGSYATVPSVTVTTGTGATLLVGFKIVSAVIVSGGATYTANDVLTISGGTAITPAQITVDTVDGGGAILTSHISNIGDYSALPTSPVSVTGGTGTGATFTALWGLLTIAVNTPGNDYETGAIVNITGGGGTGGGAATAIVASTGRIKSIAVTNGGHDYTVAPAVVIGGDGTGASATANVGTTGDSVTVAIASSFPDTNYCVYPIANQACATSVQNKTTSGFSVVLYPLDTASLSAGLMDVVVDLTH